MPRATRPSLLNNQISLEDFEAIEADIRQRMNDLDQQYHAYFEARRKLESELEEFQKQKRAMLDFVRKHRNRRGPEAIRAPAVAAANVIEKSPPTEPRAPPGDAHGPPKVQPVKQLPWGEYDYGQDKVLYVVDDAGRAGLSRQEIVDRIAEISGHTELLASVTVWLNRLKHSGRVRNRNRRWYAIKRREDAP